MNVKLRRRRIRTFWPYVAGAGAVSWLALWRGGFHPALALVPIVPFLPHAARDPGLFVEAPADAHDALSENQASATQRFRATGQVPSRLVLRE